MNKVILAHALIYGIRTYPAVWLTIWILVLLILQPLDKPMRLCSLSNLTRPVLSIIDNIDDITVMTDHHATAHYACYSRPHVGVLACLHVTMSTLFVPLDMLILILNINDITAVAL